MKILLRTEDLTVETLTSIRDDLAKYSHLPAYCTIWDALARALEAREKARQKPMYTLDDE